MTLKFGLLNALKDRTGFFTATEEAIVDFILNNVEKAVHMTIHELSLVSNTSAAAISRLCKKMEFQSFRNFKIELSKELERFRLTQRSNEEPQHPHKQIANMIFYTMQQTQEICDVKQIERIASRIHEASNVYLYGLGSSRLVAELLSMKLSLAGKHVYLIHDRDTGMCCLHNAHKGSLLIVVSQSGKTEDVITMVKHANVLGIETVALTGYNRSYLSEHVRHVLYNDASDSLRSSHKSTIYSQLFLVDLIYDCYTKSLCLEAL